MSPPAGSRDWDAATYDRVSDPQFGWALEQLSRLPLSGDEVVLDAGCGSGRVTAELVKRVPRGRVYGVDAAPSMVAHAQAALGDQAAESRMWAGIHYRSDIDAGRKLAIAVADKVIARAKQDGAQ